MSVLTRKTIVGVKKEVTEGTYEAPGAGDVVCVTGFPTIAPTIEKLERNLIKGNIGMKKPLSGMRAGTTELVTELRAAGVTAGDSDEPEINALMESAFGSVVDNSSGFSVLSSADAKTITLQAGEGASWSNFDILFVDGEVRFVVNVVGDVLTLNSDLAKGSPAPAEPVRGGFTYKPASEGHPPLSVTVFQDALNPATGPAFRAIGTRVTSMSLTDFVTGQIPKITFALELLDHDEQIDTGPANPVFETQNPPVVINGLAQRDDLQFDISTLELTLENTVARETDINEEGGTRRLFIGNRKVTGSVDPFLSQVDVILQNAWRNNTSFELFVVIGIKDAVGDVIQGSAVAIYMPNVIFTENGREDTDGVLKHALSIQAHESDLTNGDDEIFMGFI